MKRTLTLAAFLLFTFPISPMPMPRQDPNDFTPSIDYTDKAATAFVVIAILVCSYLVYKNLGDYQELTQDKECTEEAVK